MGALVIGALIAVIAYLLKQTALAIISLFIGIAILIITGNIQEKKRKEAEEEELAAFRAEARKRARQEKQDEYLTQINLCSEQALSTYENLHKHLDSADGHLDQADIFFSENAFAPFWDSIESATNMLGLYSEGVRDIQTNLDAFKNIINKYEGSPIAFPLSRQSTDILSAGTLVADRMKSIVRNAQRNFQFSMIYEQRKTNQILVAGFTNLAQALDQMTFHITSSIDDLSRSIDSLSSNVVETARAASSQLSDIADIEKQSLSEMKKQASDRAFREKRAMLMLNNIQRRRKPLL